MSNNLVGQLVIEMGADIARLRTDFSEAQSIVRQSTRQIVQSVDGMKAEIKSSMEAISASVHQVIGAFGLLSAVDVGAKMLETMSSFEQLQVALNSVMGSTQGGSQAFAWIKQFAVDTPYEVNQVAQTFRLLKAYGIDPMNGSLKAVADMASYTGKGFQGMQSAALALGQAWTKAKLQGQDILQMVDAGIPVWDILSKATGKNTAELMKLSEKGMLGRDAILALMSGMEQMAGGASAAQMKTLAGEWSNLTDAIKNSLDEVRRNGALDGLKVGVEDVTNLVPSMSATFQAFGSVVSSIFSGIGDIVHAFTASLSSDAGRQVSALDIVKGALEVLRDLFLGLSVSIQMAFAGVMITIETVEAGIKQFAGMARAAFHMDWEGVKSAWRQGGDDIARIYEQGGQKLVEIANRTRQEILKFSAFSPQQTGPKIDTSATIHAKSGNDLIQNGGVKPKGKHVSNMQKWMDELNQKRDAEGVYHELSRADEIKFWEEKLAQTKKGTRDQIAVLHQLVTLQRADYKQRLADAKKANAEEIKLEIAKASAQAEQSKLRLKGEQQTDAYLLASRQISAEEKLKRDQDAATAEYNIERTLLEQKAQIYKDDAKKKQAVLAQLEKLDAQHNLQVQKNAYDTALAVQKQWSSMLRPITQAFDTSIKGMIMGTQTWQKAMSNILQSIVGEFVSMGIKIVTQWIANEMAKTTATIAGTTTRTAVQQAANSQGLAASALLTVKSIMGDAAKTFSGTFASLSGIPIVGPVMAAAAAPAAMATVAAVTSSVASSAGGAWQIPADRLNFVHKDETILPADKSKGLDELINNGSRGNPPIHIYAKPGDSVTVDQLQRLLKKMGRNFTRF